MTEPTDKFINNWLWAEWATFSILVSIFGILVLYFSNSLPSAIHRIVKYGKSANVPVKSVKTVTRLKKFEIPKRYFFHFYAFALMLYISLAVSAYRIYFTSSPKQVSASSSFVVLLDKLTGDHRQASVPPESVMIGLCLLIVQVSRRLAECTMISVYSEARMNIIHYIFGYSFYFGVGMSLVAEAPGFTGARGQSSAWSVPKTYHFLKPCHVIGVLLFIWSSFVQFESHQILANLRKDKSGRVITHQHSIPRGKWFDIVSCPHYMAEILIYLSISIVLGGQSLTWWMVFLFVITNQLIVGKFNHNWYTESFKDYPKSRRAVIPYLLYIGSPYIIEYYFPCLCSNIMASYQIPDLGPAMAELEKLSNQELKDLCNSDTTDKIDEILSQMPKIKELETEREMLMASVKSLAEFNIAKQPTFEENKRKLRETLVESNAVKDEIEKKGTKLLELSKRTSLESTLAVILSTTSEAEEESEGVAQSFLDGTIQYDTFVSDYIEKRKLAHLRRVKADKLRLTKFSQ
ncbi:Polyprenol reductase [Fragariocoptes setiger]|uniref:Polyprenal reductase n=1 Tax=Fragariocoptes setiger TaxID=1670756 RepID=A0ABQ7SCC3_9ACAR|nr:Polyprenol reductase [Fragariocoptes setiger]